MIAQRIPGILPPLTREEQLEVMSIYSIAGKPLTKMRPFQAPHHTISPQALAGGGRIPKPGVLSLAHRGILFLDEMPEFSANVLEVLRQPLEEKKCRSQELRAFTGTRRSLCLSVPLIPVPADIFPTVTAAGVRSRRSGIILENFRTYLRQDRYLRGGSAGYH